MSLKWVMVFAIAMVLLTAETSTEAHRPRLTQNDPEMKSLVGGHIGDKTKPYHGAKGCKKGPHPNCKQHHG
ncbi:hypothetical protein E5676_scaffold772G00020 [Cucumis melo var. makuwa]|uniref:Uncharacterized protein n=1 Tax=Cucumis melo var. makuwa TaxID=1194695 RepID=A0A5A7VIV6_CUCMM|nr:hypothetical protein E6C27_scaffold90G001210 [Cucumis melo var. makuwa]TYK01420.1 hypothetical protein E5676_scaffold772G00020 [Cucumis melo var. makuwa]